MTNKKWWENGLEHLRVRQIIAKHSVGNGKSTLGFIDDNEEVLCFKDWTFEQVSENFVGSGLIPVVLNLGLLIRSF